MTSDSIVQRLIRQLEFHLTLQTPSLEHPHYKLDLFRIFLAAWNEDFYDPEGRHSLTGDALRDLLRVQWIDRKAPDERDAASKILERILQSWDEWHFAVRQLEQGGSLKRHE